MVSLKSFFVLKSPVGSCQFHLREIKFGHLKNLDTQCCGLKYCVKILYVCSSSGMCGAVLHSQNIVSQTENFHCQRRSNSSGIIIKMGMVMSRRITRTTIRTSRITTMRIIRTLIINSNKITNRIRTWEQLHLTENKNKNNNLLNKLTQHYNSPPPPQGRRAS